MSERGKCNGCGAPIVWRYTPAGKLMPLSPEVIKQPLPGAYVITSNEDCRPAHPLFDSFHFEFHMNHWATCPKVGEFKR